MSKESEPDFALFSINNFPIRSFNIPAPVIGIHLINPNPHVLNPNPTVNHWLPALDVDPYSNTEIITRSTHLTVAELAGVGVTFSKPKVEPTDSNSSANSEVVGMNNVMVLSKEDTQLFHCDICNIDCDTEFMLTRHNEGKKHIKNMQKLPDLSDAATVLQSQTSADYVDRGSNLEDKVNMQQQLLWCKVCNVRCMGEKTLESHILGRTHQQNLGKIPSTTIASTANILNSTQIASPSLDGKSIKGKIVTSKGEFCNSDGKKEIPLTPNAYPKSTNVKNVEGNRCELCVITCSSYEELKRHISGKKHKKNVKKSESLFQDEKRNIEVERCKRKADSWLISTSPDTKKKQRILKENEEVDDELGCVVCNFVCNTSEAFVTHLGSQQHSQMVLKQVNIVGSK